MMDELSQVGNARGKHATAEAVRLIESPLGPMTAVACGDALCRLWFAAPDATAVVRPSSPGADSDAGGAAAQPAAVLDRLERELAAYFDGSLRHFGVPLRPEGTMFQLRVWAALLDIPYGQTRSYTEQARAIGRTDAVRAVASANGDNPIAIVVPCHRVIGADGSLTGYGGGLDRKRWLLDHEQGPRLF